LTHSKIGITLFAVPVKTISKFEFQLINTVGARWAAIEILPSNIKNSEHSFDQSTTVPISNTSHHIPIAEPNFPRVAAVPFAIGMWVLDMCIP
jgi:hypothetical protein